MLSHDEQCKFVGGPHDGEEFPMKVTTDEWAFASFVAAMTAAWEDAWPALQAIERDFDPEALSEADEAQIEQRIEEALNNANAPYGRPAAGGVMYLRIAGTRRFEFVGYLSAAQYRQWKLTTFRF